MIDKRSRPASKVGVRQIVDDNVDRSVVEDFGREWNTFDQSLLPDSERQAWFDAYFAVFPWDRIRRDAIGFDAGCGSGRWAMLAAPRVGHLHCIDPSSAIDIAKQNLRHLSNCSFHKTTIGEIPLADNSMDFGYSLGVLHHLPDTQQGISDCVRKLKRGSPFLVYLYYAFDNQPTWYRGIWKASDFARQVISRWPHSLKYILSQLIAAAIYFPLARAAAGLKLMGRSIHSWPLAAYHDKSFYTMRTDALDRFGTRLETRFTRAEVHQMLEIAGLEDIQISPQPPFYCAVGFKK